MKDEHQGVKISRSDRAAVARELQDFIAGNPDIFGGADIYNLDFGSPIARAGILAAVLTGLVNEEHKLAVRQFVVIIPPSTDQASAFETIWNQLADSFRVLAGRELRKREIDVLQARLHLISTIDWHHSSVLDIIARQNERTAVIVTEAANYRDYGVTSHVSPGADIPLLREDVWVPQLHALASTATKLAKERGIYIALDTNELRPSRRMLADLLLTIDGCGVMGASSDDDPEAILAAHVDQWNAWIREGRLGRTLRDVEALPSELNRYKSSLKIQLFYRAGLSEHALNSIRDRMNEEPELDFSSRVKLARVAQDANAAALAAELLTSAIDGLNCREDLESALITAYDASLTDIEEKIAARLRILFPGSPSLEHRRLRQLVQSRDYVSAAVVARDKLSDEKKACFYEALASHFAGAQVPDYHALIATANGDGALADAYRTASVRDAITRNLPVHAFDLVLPLPMTSAQSQYGEQLLLETLKALFLVSTKGGGWPVPLERFQTAILALVERLASNPENRRLRVGLSSLLQPDVAGTAGVALLAALALQLVSRPLELRKRAALEGTSMDWLIERKPFLNAAFAWMKAEEPVMVGRSVLPDELLTEPADEVVSAIADYLDDAPLGTTEDLDAAFAWLALATSVVPHSSDPDYDLPLIRLVAGKLANVGDIQHARDLAEQALISCAGSERRRRLGWFAIADVYARGGNHLESLLAISCTFSADNSGDELAM